MKKKQTETVTVKGKAPHPIIAPDGSVTHFTEDAITRLREAATGERNPNYNKPRPDTVKDAISQTLTGRSHSEERKNKNRVAHSCRYLIMFPDRHFEEVLGLREFSVEHSLNGAGLANNGKSKEYCAVKMADRYGVRILDQEAAIERLHELKKRKRGGNTLVTPEQVGNKLGHVLRVRNIQHWQRSSVLV